MLFVLAFADSDGGVLSNDIGWMFLAGMGGGLFVVVVFTSTLLWFLKTVGSPTVPRTSAYTVHPVTCG